jgi:hypothetical protein
MRLHQVTRNALCVGLLAVTAAGCSNAVGSEVEPGADPAAKVVNGKGSVPARITLSEEAQRRLGIETTAIRSASKASASGSRLVMPYAAVVYDADGKAWAFAAASPRTYQRAPLVILSVHDNLVTLSSGPSAGTEVVTVGAAELVGAEAGISGEE